MTATLWAAVPSSERRPALAWGWYGCPYAVRRRGGGYRRCAGSVPVGAGVCRAHDPTRPASGAVPGAAPTVWASARNRLERGMPYPRPADELRWFRSLTDADVAAVRMVGRKIGAAIREARDTWDDERVMAVFGFAPPPKAARPDVFWAARPDVFSVVGG